MRSDLLGHCACIMRACVYARVCLFVCARACVRASVRACVCVSGRDGGTVVSPMLD